MPAGFDPRKVYKLSLDVYQGLPEAERPTFFYRRINGHEYNEISKVTDVEGKTFAEQGEQIYNALKIGLTGWQHMTDPANEQPIDFDPNRIADVLDPVEAMELVNKRLFSARLSGAEKKTSDSPA